MKFWNQMPLENGTAFNNSWWSQYRAKKAEWIAKSSVGTIWVARTHHLGAERGLEGTLFEGSECVK
jgi:hypothetical protein